MRALLGGLGNPELKTPTVLVAGTNGKGSTAALLSAILTASSYRTGLFTSPHLERVEERIRVNGAAIATARLATELERVIAAARKVVDEPITYFEALTSSAFCFFESQQVDVAIFEVGLGGRLDASNVGEPVMSLITGIGFDHQRQLGNTLAEISVEKAGVMRAGRPTLTWVEAAEATEAIRQVAEQVGADLIEVPERVSLDQRIERDSAGQEMRLTTGLRTYDLSLALGGRHQASNAALAVSAAEGLAEQGFERVDRRAVERGVAACRWPGRLEWIEVPGGEVLLDAAHNGAGVRSLGVYLAQLGRPFTLLFGMLNSKADREALRALFALAGEVVLTTPPSPRAMPPSELAERVGAETQTIEVCAEPNEALSRAVELSSGGLLVISGSLYLVGAMRTQLRERFGVAPPADQLFAGLEADAAAPIATSLS
jgi:dihydrofolate synthase/folylpolyglutamate synthase